MKTLAELMHTDLLLLKDNLLASEALELLHQRGIGGAPVVDAQGRANGVFSQTGLNLQTLRGSRQILDRPLYEIMTPFVFGLRAEDSVQKALELLLENRIHRVVICDEEHFPTGILTSLDLLRAVLSSLQPTPSPKNPLLEEKSPGQIALLFQQKLLEVMSRPVISVHPEDSLEHFMRLVDHHAISATPVIDPEKGQMVGLVSQADVALRLRSNRRSLAESQALDVMTPFAFRLLPDKSLQQALEMMVTQSIHRVVLVDDEARPEGILTALDVVRLVLSQASNQPS